MSAGHRSVWTFTRKHTRHTISHDINRLSSPTEISPCHIQVVYRVPPSTIPDTVQESLQRIAD